jgi:hypothetical protein
MIRPAIIIGDMFNDVVTGHLELAGREYYCAFAAACRCCS